MVVRDIHIYFFKEFIHVVGGICSFYFFHILGIIYKQSVQFLDIVCV